MAIATTTAGERCSSYGVRLRRRHFAEVMTASVQKCSRKLLAVWAGVVRLYPTEINPSQPQRNFNIPSSATTHCQLQQPTTFHLISQRARRQHGSGPKDQGQADTRPHGEAPHDCALVVCVFGVGVLRAGVGGALGIAWRTGVLRCCRQPIRVMEASDSPSFPRTDRSIQPFPSHVSLCIP